MNDFELDNDEGILLRAFFVERYSADGDNEEFDELILTNKKLIGILDEEGNADERELSTIKVVRGKPQVFEIEDGEYGRGIQIFFKTGEQEYYVFDRAYKTVPEWTEGLIQAVKEANKKERTNKSNTEKKKASANNANNVSQSSYCTNCGVALNPGSNFCHKCGTPCDVGVSNSRRICEYAGKIVNCPQCGELINSFVANCPSCGYELRGIKTSSAVKEFETRYESAKSLTKRIDLVKTFSIPNTKEDIQEFLILAVSNMNPEAYESGKNKSKEVRLSSAWETKAEQAYQKASMMFPNHSEFNGCYEKLNKKLQQIKEIKRKVKIIKSTIKASGIIIGIALGLLGIFLNATIDSQYLPVSMVGGLIVFSTVIYIGIESEES